MKSIIIFLMMLSLGAASQTYIIAKNVSNVNGDPGPMMGVPGDLFATTVTFSNTTGSSIHLFMDRYEKDIPPYWYSCYCYIQCHDKYRDTISIFIAPGGFEDVTLQFKTDSVNPGKAISNFRVHQTGFESKPDTIRMVASTFGYAGVADRKTDQNDLFIHPNPVNTMLRMNAEPGSRYRILDITGRTITAAIKESGEEGINVGALKHGVYFLEVRSANSIQQKKFIKQ